MGILHDTVSSVYHTLQNLNTLVLLTMNASLKVLLYIFFVVVIFYFVQERFFLFDISFSGEEKQGKTEKEGIKQESIVEIYNEEGDSMIVEVELAQTDEEKRMGLSGRRNLGDYEGMLFVMDEVSASAFWMKDMLIPLDIIFIDSKFFIVDIKENIQPCGREYCPSIYSQSPYLYVLEVNAGFAKSNRVVVGNSLVFNILSSP